MYFIHSGVQTYAVHSFVLFKESLCAPTPPIYAAVSSPFTSEGKGQFDNSLYTLATLFK